MRKTVANYGAKRSEEKSNSEDGSKQTLYKAGTVRSSECLGGREQERKESKRSKSNSSAPKPSTSSKQETEGQDKQDNKIPVISSSHKAQVQYKCLLATNTM